LPITEDATVHIHRVHKTEKTLNLLYHDKKSFYVFCEYVE
jgi:hypothetical protein